MAAVFTSLLRVSDGEPVCSQCGLPIQAGIPYRESRRSTTPRTDTRHLGDCTTPKEQNEHNRG